MTEQEFEESLRTIEQRAEWYIFKEKDVMWLISSIRELKSKLEQSEAQLKAKSAALKKAKELIQFQSESECYPMCSCQDDAIKCKEEIEKLEGNDNG